MKRLLIAVAVLACAAIAEGQGGMPPGKWWQRPEVIRELQLTSEQQGRLDEIFRGAANDLIDAKGDVEKLQIAIRGELDRPQLRKAEALRIAGQLSAARGRLFEREVAMLLDMRAVLNEQQWARMRKHLDRQGGGRPRGRRP
ncbi:MAG TPA: periplasmic heavy metal sensor [Thermoanaerobaculia bacterium]|nr:periplasmic heavy metal sensor [Thermoanaerobaculia bacterium]